MAKLHLNSSLGRRALLAGLGLAVATPALVYAKENRPRPLGDQASVAAVLASGAKPILPAGATVHIPTFRVEVISEVSKSAQTTGFAAGGRASQSSTYTLANIDHVQMSRLTQMLYHELVADLKARGFVVATPAETRADPDLGPLMNGAPSPQLAPSKAGSSAFYAPAGLNVVFEPLDSSAPQGNAMAAFSAAGAMMQRAVAVNRAATARKVAVIQPKYTLGFAELSSSTEGFGGRLTDVATVSANIGLRVEPEMTNWSVVVPSSNRDGMVGGQIQVDTALRVAGDALTHAVNATPAGQVQSTAAANLFGAVIAGYTGSQNTYAASTKAVQPTATYRLTAQGALSTVQKAFLGRITGAAK